MTLQGCLKRQRAQSEFQCQGTSNQQQRRVREALLAINPGNQVAEASIKQKQTDAGSRQCGNS